MKLEYDNIEQLVAQLKSKLVLATPNKYAKRRARKPPSALSVDRARVAKREAKAAGTRQLREAWYYLRKTYRWRNKDRAERGLKPVVFDLPLEDWKKLWNAAGMVQDGNNRIWAFRLRGSRKGQARLMRIDQDGAFTLDNCVIVWNGTAIAVGKRL